eukprot:TRINITY_DN3593_c0_g1_i2.p1 TRINITY_DN3593_c0_g1~~TRINITY_DN3593_c0_g1_i2.p1  ORF type:complete len:947 (+),score=199.82 TRINITY_DN3593_c0_g1_i2:176-3016(+)
MRLDDWLSLPPGETRTVAMTRWQVACLMCASMLGLYPADGDSVLRLFRCHEPHFSELQSSVVSCWLNYFHQLATMPAPSMSERQASLSRQLIAFTRNVVPPPLRRLSHWLHSTAPLCPALASVAPIETHTESLQAIFSNPQPARHAFQPLVPPGQAEIMFLAAPEMVAVHFLRAHMADHEAIGIRGASRMSSYTGYGNTFRCTGIYRERVQEAGSALNSISRVAMNAFPFGPRDQYKKAAVLRDLLKTYAAFSMPPVSAEGESDASDWTHDAGAANEDAAAAPTIGCGCGEESSRAMADVPTRGAVATGKWGCGYFRGNPFLKSLLQWIAASEARCCSIDVVCTSPRDAPLRNRIDILFSLLQRAQATVGSLLTHILEYGEKAENPDGGDLLQSLMQNTLEQARSCDDPDLFYDIAMALMKVHLRFAEYEKNGLFDPIFWWTKAVTVDPSQKSSYWQMAAWITNSLDGSAADERRLQQAAALLQTAAEGPDGLATAAYDLGRAFEHGRGVQKDKEKAIEWYKCAHERGSRPAIQKLLTLHLTSELGKHYFDLLQEQLECAGASASGECGRNPGFSGELPGTGNGTRGTNFSYGELLRLSGQERMAARHLDATATTNPALAHQWNPSLVKRRKILCAATRFQSFAPPRPRCTLRYLVDGEEGFAAIALAIKKAQCRIFIAGWILTPTMLLTRVRGHTPDDTSEHSLYSLLLERAAAGVHVYALIWDHPRFGNLAQNRAQENKLLLLQGNESIGADEQRIHVCLSAALNTLWSHHQKIVCVDDGTAFVGGLDLGFARWDNPSHPVVDTDRLYHGGDHYNSRFGVSSYNVRSRFFLFVFFSVAFLFPLSGFVALFLPFSGFIPRRSFEAIVLGHALCDRRTSHIYCERILISSLPSSLLLLSYSPPHPPLAPPPPPPPTPAPPQNPPKKQPHNRPCLPKGYGDCFFFLP